jgi:hypothetical protein
MKIEPILTKPGILATLLAGIVCLPLSCAALELSGQGDGQSFTSSAAPTGMEGAPAPGASSLLSGAGAAADAPDTSLFADGTRAVNEARWADAVKIFANVAGQHGEHADGALYWKAYAQDKLGQSQPAQDTCAELRTGYPKSPWIDDCGALEVELRAKAGKPVEIEAGQSDDVKLLALNAMMRQNEARALAEIQAILNGDASERLKKAAQLILSQHYSDVTYAQIVRISYVEGDVRIQRGEPNGKASSGAWEKATADVPLETGFSLVTGDGRAEIEFENASTLYLGENSVLTFNDLHTTAGVPYTELGLLSGTVSLYIHPYVAGEVFTLRTPINDLVSRYPDKTYARVESFTDATAITPLEGGEMRLWGVAKDAVVPGKTWTYRQGQLWVEEDAPHEETFAAWDKWVGDRVAQRTAAIHAVMEASGLTAPIPGMAEMEGEGTFFDCAPYGTCWEPKDADEGEQSAKLRPGERGPAFRKSGYQRPSLVLASFSPAAQSAQSGPASSPQISEHELDFPCTPGALRYRTMRDPITGKVTVIDRTFVPRQRYGWAVCHAGSWIHHKKHFVWVAGGKRHHVDPVRWVKSDRKVAFVPLHPYDVKGQPPINAKHEVFEVSGKNEVVVHPVKFDPNRPIEYLKEAPKEYRNAFMRPLAQVEAPHMEAHAFVHEPGSKGAEISRAAIPIHFDPKSQSFTVPRVETHGGKTTTVFAPISNHSGSLQARGDSFSGGSGFRGGGASSSSGSGFHGGGGSSSSSSGGGSHSGGGGGASASSSSSSGGSSSGGSSGGGSHH